MKEIMEIINKRIEALTSEYRKAYQNYQEKGTMAKCRLAEFYRAQIIALEGLKEELKEKSNFIQIPYC